MAFSHGMNIEAVRNLATQVDAQAEAVGSVVNSVTSLVAQLGNEWAGPDSVAFAGWWNDQHRPALLRLQEALAGLASSARNNAQAQEDASRG